MVCHCRSTFTHELCRPLSSAVTSSRETSHCMPHKIPSDNTRGLFRCCWSTSLTSNTQFTESLIPVGKLSAVSSSEILTDKRRGSSAGSRASSLSVSNQLINQTGVCFYFVLSKFISIIVTVNTLIRELSWEH